MIVTALAIFGALHLIAYGLASFSAVAVLFINWIVERFKLKADMLRAYKRILDERAALKESSDNGNPSNEQ